MARWNSSCYWWCAGHSLSVSPSRIYYYYYVQFGVYTHAYTSVQHPIVIWRPPRALSLYLCSPSLYVIWPPVWPLESPETFPMAIASSFSCCSTPRKLSKFPHARKKKQMKSQLSAVISDAFQSLTRTHTHRPIQSQRYLTVEGPFYLSNYVNKVSAGRQLGCMRAHLLKANDERRAVVVHVEIRSTPSLYKSWWGREEEKS